MRCSWKTRLGRLLLILAGLLISPPLIFGVVSPLPAPLSRNKGYTIRADWETAPFAEADQELWFTIAPLPPEPWDELSITTRIDGKVYERGASPDGFVILGLTPGRHRIDVSLSTPTMKEVGSSSYEVFVIGEVSVSILSPQAEELIVVSNGESQATAAITIDAPGISSSIAEQAIRAFRWFLDDEQLSGVQRTRLEIPVLSLGSHTLRFEVETTFGGFITKEVEFIAVPDINLEVIADGYSRTEGHLTLRTFEQVDLHAELRMSRSAATSGAATGKLGRLGSDQESISKEILWFVDGIVYERGEHIVFEADPGNHTVWAEYHLEGYQIRSKPLNIEVRNPIAPRIILPAEPGYPFIGEDRTLFVAGEGEADARYVWTLETSGEKLLTAEGKEAAFDLDLVGDIEGSLLTLTTIVGDWQESRYLDFVAWGIPGLSVDLVVPDGNKVGVGRAFPIITRVTTTGPSIGGGSVSFRYSYTLDGDQPLTYSTNGSQTMCTLQTPGAHLLRVVVHDSSGNAALAEAVVVGVIPWDLRVIPSGPLLVNSGEITRLSLELQPGHLAPPGDLWWEIAPEDPDLSPIRVEGSQFSYQFDQVGRYVVTGHFLSDDEEVALESTITVNVLECQPPLVLLNPVRMRERVNPGERVMIQAVVQSALTGNPVEAHLSWTRNGVILPAAQDGA